VLERLSGFLFGGTRGFNAAEARVLSFLSEALPAQERQTLARQLGAVRKVQRQNPGRLVVAYYRKGDDVPRLPYPGYAYCLAHVTYMSRGHPRTTSLVLHDGRFMSFERNVPQQLSDIEAPCSVVLHPKGFESVAAEIDAEEHGEPPA
jgi:hypothetical protein